MNCSKGVVMVTVAGAALFAQAGFGDFMKKAAAVTDAVTGTTQASDATTAAQQTADAVANPGQTAQTAAQQAIGNAVAPAQAAVDDAVPGTVNDISMAELAKRQQANPALLVIDVRTSGEFLMGHVPHAKNIPVDVIGAKIGNVAPGLNTPVYVYCQSGARARTAAVALVAKGYKRVYNAGGLDGWNGALVQ